MRTLIYTFDRRFLDLNMRSIELLKKIPDDKLFLKPRDQGQTFAMFSCGEYILRSAAMVEKTFGGITTRLWDDPFEWTLPEELATGERVRDYLAEVENTRIHGFSFFTSDADLTKEIQSPEKLRPIFEILLETLCHAEHFQGRSFAVFQMLFDEKLPRLSC